MAVKWKAEQSGKSFTSNLGIVSLIVCQFADGKFMSFVDGDSALFAHDELDSAKSAAISRARERLTTALKELEDSK